MVCQTTAARLATLKATCTLAVSVAVVKRRTTTALLHGPVWYGWWCYKLESTTDGCAECSVMHATQRGLHGCTTYSGTFIVSTKTLNSPIHYGCTGLLAG
jgi:hypothetical protein